MRPVRKAATTLYMQRTAKAQVCMGTTKSCSSIEGTIDLYTKKDRDPWVEGIQRALKRKRIAFRLSEISYEQETGYLHYQWIFETS